MEKTTITYDQVFDLFKDVEPLGEGTEDIKFISNCYKPE